MASPTYTRLLNTAAAYVPDRSTAEGAIQRQLGSVTPDSMTTADLLTLMNRFTTALKLYVPDPARREEMVGKIKALA